MTAHPVGSKMKVLVSSRDPKKFVLPEDSRISLILGICFIAGGAAALTGMIELLIQ